jgi:hypothetical protein
MAFDGFGGWGHAFNEIYDSRRRQWVLIDPFNSFYLVDSSTGRPLSALEFRERLYDGDVSQSIRALPIEPTAFGFRNQQHLINYFTRGRDQFYLWWGNNVLSYDTHPLVRVGNKLSRSAEQVLGLSAGVQPTIKVLLTDSNGPFVESLFRVRQELAAVAAVGFLGAVLFLFQCRLLFIVLKHRT